MKRRLAAEMGRALDRLRLMKPLLSITDRWMVRRSSSGSPVFPFVIPRRDPAFHILVYHRVNDDADLLFGGPAVATFERQMLFLSEHFTVLPLEDLLERARSGTCPPDAVAITFDDGYRDNFENAFPILNRLGLPATVFLTTGPIESGHWLWQDRVYGALQCTTAESVAVDGRTFPLGTLPEKRVAMRRFLAGIKKLGPADRDRQIEQFVADLGVGEIRREEWAKLSWDQIAEMADNGITFGAHTVTHPILSRVSPTEAVREILDSKKMIEERLGTQVRLFAYPNGNHGDFNDAVKASVRNAGFLCAVSSVWGANGSDADRFELRRVWMRAMDPDPSMSALRVGWAKFRCE